MSAVLALDLGTTYFKICLFDSSLQLVARRCIPTPATRPAPGRVQIAVPAFRHCLTAAVHDIARQSGGLRDVARVTFASQANSFTVLDDHGRALIPFLLWSDQRACGTEFALTSFTEQADFYAETGIAELDGHFMLAKLEWLRQLQPQTIARTRRICGLSDYLTWWLTGNHLTEASIVGISGLANIHSLRYRYTALAKAGIEESCLPQIVRAGSDAGEIRTEIRERWGVSDKCRLTIGCLDQFAGAIGAGVANPGEVCETTGTVLATVRRFSEFSPTSPPGVFQGPAREPGSYYQMVFSSISAELLEAYRNRQPDRPTYAQLDELAAQVADGANGLKLDPNATTMPSPDLFTGRAALHHRGHEVRAIMEGVAWELRRQLTTLCGEQWPTVVRANGGAARSTVWLAIKSRILGCPVEAVDCEEPTCLGAAKLAQSY